MGVLVSDEEDDQEVMSVMIYDEVCCMPRTYAGLSGASAVSRYFVKQLTLKLEKVCCLQLCTTQESLRM